MEIRLRQITIACVTKRILGRIQLFECAEFVLRLVQFDNLILNFAPSFLGLYNLLSGRLRGKKKPCSATVIFWSRESLALITNFGAAKDL